MYWLYFMRDLYSTSTPAAPAPTMHPAPATTKPRHQPLRASTAAVVYAPIDFPKKQAAAPAPVAPRRHKETDMPAAAQASSTSPLDRCLRRLSVDGDHAFGLWDEEAGFSLFSANFERVTGLMTGECAGHEWIYAVHHQQQYNVNEALLAAATQGHDGRALVQSRRDETDDWRWLMLDIKAPSKTQPYVMVLFRDLSEQRALEEALKQTQSSLALSERGRAAFLSSMSHELRTPLNAIMGFAEMMKEGVMGPLPNETYKEYVSHIHDSGQNLLGKISALLDIASMDSGGLRIDEEEFALRPLVDELVEMHSHHAFARAQRLTIDCPGNFHLRADRAKLLCAASHLITNALRHSPDGAVVRICVRLQPGDSLVLSIHDTGEGIASTQLAHIRDALTSESAYLNVESGGIGLGLSLAKELAELHQGRVVLDSIRKKGTVAALVLPIERVTQGIPRKRREMIAD